ncbi:MAG: hypothetical protein JSV52_09870 [Candidatus Zixiibacteriota bacterium]|nr:MAG: hypothetical protein JSV52_09870 [candidate division Zixibacteria bacterium]
MAARTEVELIGADIPSRYSVGSNFILNSSDSLYLNGRLLQRGVDYVFDTRRGAFDLSRIGASGLDTLRIVYRPVPAWLKTLHGTPLPEVSPDQSENIPEIPEIVRAGVVPTSGDISISGAKTFRFTARSSGSSNFSQSLDLSLSGNLAPGLELSGAISDRGYDPSYGTANSRLNELDKINLKLSSRIFSAQVGDILLQDPMAPSAAPKRVSGASMNIWQRQGHLHAAVARPKGRFETARLSARDNTQGPYRVTSGTAVAPVVPGSESVWLDGIKLERGGDKDYTIDYPSGAITFNVNHPIDARSRIEVDYEPLLTNYKGELLETGGGIALADSTVIVDVSWLREGDDRDEPFAGELTAEELDALAAVGDQIENAVRPGVISDTLGSYILVPDSLPDTVYQYVGEANGDFSITFSFFGSGQGDYVFLGAGQYLYAGPGRGEYLPLKVIPAPERTDHYQASLRLKDHVLSDMVAEFHQTQYDRNLLSSLDDDDNDGLFYSVFGKRDWKLHGQDNYVSVRTRKKEAAFRVRQRLYNADFARNFFLPANFRPQTDETKHDFDAVVNPRSSISVRPYYSRLDYSGKFSSATGGADVTFRLSSGSMLSAGWGAIRTELDTLGQRRIGTADRYRAGTSYQVTSNLDIAASYEHDSRTNEYSAEDRGTRYHQARGSIGTGTERLTYEFHSEDSLVTDWLKQVRRHRISASSSRDIGNLNYSTLITYQSLERVRFSEDNLLGRLGLNYSDPSRQFGLGASYLISDETRNSRGLTYLEVEQGQGDYILENGEYVPDPDGNYVRVEETLSETSRVRRGEKSFHLNKTWPMVLLRLNSNIEEELLPEGKREYWWIIPVLSDMDQPYLYYSRRYSADLRVFPIRFGHAVNFDYREDREVRSVAGVPRKRDDFTGAISLKQAWRQALFEEQVELFRYERDTYYSGGGNIDGYRTGFRYRQSVETAEIATGLAYRRADSESGGQSRQYSISVDTRAPVLHKGELRTSLELYRQSLENTVGSSSFLLTDNRAGKDGAVWSVALRYGIKGGMRVNLTISGRHSDDRVARITGRGEFVAGF